MIQDPIFQNLLSTFSLLVWAGKCTLRPFDVYKNQVHFGNILGGEGGGGRHDYVLSVIPFRDISAIDLTSFKDYRGDSLSRSPLPISKKINGNILGEYEDSGMGSVYYIEIMGKSYNYLLNVNAQSFDETTRMAELETIAQSLKVN